MSDLSEKEYATISALKQSLDDVCSHIDTAAAAGLTVAFNIRTVGGKSELDKFELTRAVGVSFTPPARH